MAKPPSLPGLHDARTSKRKKNTAHEATGPVTRVTPANRSVRSPAARARIFQRDFGRYELLMEMGRGGMATLYLARLRGPEQFEKLIALKKIHDSLSSDPAFLSMFLDEARIAARIHHPNVVTVFDLGSVDQTYYIAMEYIHGHSLADVLRAASRNPEQLPWRYGARIVADAACGLHAAHSLCNSRGQPLNVVHRDVSPQNVLLSYDGHVKVVDFGIAYAGEKLTQTRAGVLMGKTGYMSPEQADGRQVDRRADVFALGILLYEAVTLTRLFDEPTDAATLVKIRQAEVPDPRTRNPSIPVALVQIVMKALAKNPDARFATAQQLADGLNELLLLHDGVLTSHHLARPMERFFAGARALKEQQIQDSVTAAADRIQDKERKDAASKKDLTEAETASKSSRLPFRWLLLSGGMGALLSLLAVMGFFLFSPDPPIDEGDERGPSSSIDLPVAPPKASTAPRAVVKPAADRSMLKLRILPLDAQPEVIYQGKRYTGSEIALHLPSASIPERALIRAVGYQEETLLLIPGSSSEITFRLVPLVSSPKPPRQKALRARRKRRGRGRSHRRSIQKLLR